MTKITNTKQKQQHHTEISEWLIDSGCSNHMTPHPEDLIMDISSTKSLVEVANGNIVKAPKKGTVKIKITDVKTNNTYSILLEDVLLVPGLSRRLFSVNQWTKSGGAINFNGETCRMSYKDTSNPNIKFSMNLNAPFSPKDSANCLVSPTANTAKVQIPSNLLHKRLGHRSIQALGVASDNNFWEDAKLTPDYDPFCWGCKLTFSRKNPRGKSELQDPKLTPGSCLMLDLQQNTIKYGLN